MNCEICDKPMHYHDYNYIGNYAAYEKGYPDSGFKVVSDVYKCDNEECEAFGERVTINR